MQRKLLMLTAISAGMVLCTAVEASAIELCGRRCTECCPWHGTYYNTSWGMPVALVVPPGAKLQTHYGWGVGGTRVSRIDHKFTRDWPGPGSYDRRMFQPTPRWPSDTDQFGVYYVRGPRR